MQEVILALLRLFRSRVLDSETNAWVIELACDRNQWPGAKALFSRIRRRSLDAIDRHRVQTLPSCAASRCAESGQYVFEELCLKSLFNETYTDIPFDPSSSYYVAEFAIRLARTIDVSVSEVLGIIAAQANPETAFYRQVFPRGTGPAAAVTRVPGRLVATEEVIKEFPDLQQFPSSQPGPYERTMGKKIARLLGVFQGYVPDATSNAILLKLALTVDRWSAGHALFDILHKRLLVAMRARDQVIYLQHEFEQSCLQSLYNATDTVHPFAPGAPFWVAGGALRLARAVGATEATVVGILAPDE